MFRRSPDPVSLITGLAFTGLGLTLLVGHGTLHMNPRWVWPGVLIVLAVALLPGVPGRHRGPEGGDPPPPPPAAPPASGAGGAAEGL